MDTAYHAIVMAVKSKNYTITQMDSAMSTLKAWKSVADNSENKILITLRRNKDVYILTFTKEGKVKENLDDVRNELHEAMRIPLIRLSKYKGN